MPFLGERHQNIFMVSWTCRRALLNWPTLRSGGVFRLRGATAISRQARAAEGLLGKMSSRSILEGGAMARCSHGAFPGGNPRQVLRSMHPKSGLGREKRPFPARFARHVSENGLTLARFARHASEKPCKQSFGNTPREDLATKGPLSLHGPLESCTARRSCHS